MRRNEESLNRITNAKAWITSICQVTEGKDATQTKEDSGGYLHTRGSLVCSTELGVKNNQEELVTKAPGCSACALHSGRTLTFQDSQFQLSGIFQSYIPHDKNKMEYIDLFVLISMAPSLQKQFPKICFSVQPHHSTSMKTKQKTFATKIKLISLSVYKLTYN